MNIVQYIILFAQKYQIKNHNPNKSTINYTFANGEEVFLRSKKKTPKYFYSEVFWKTAPTYSPTLHRSTIGVNGLNFSVRNGKRWNPVAKSTLIRLFKTYQTSIKRTTKSKHQPARKSRAISKARLWRHRLYTCLLSTSSSLTTLREISSCGRLRT